jgi:AraC-like DNA-binding protein
MSVEFEVDLADLESASRGQSILRGADVLGPHESILGATNNVYRRAADMILHVMSLSVKEEFVYRVVRRNVLTVQFTVEGGWRRAGRRFESYAGTIRITGERSEIYFPKRYFFGTSIVVLPEQLIDVFGLQVDNVPDLYRPLFNSPPGAAPVMELPMPASAWAAIQEIVGCKFGEPLRREYLSAKTAELICYAVAEINKLRRAAPFVAVARSTRERVKIEMAEAIYRREISNPPALDEVAMRVGLSRNKLVGGFREMFDTTPHDFSRQLRLRRAHELLVHATLPVQRIAAATGYNSHAAFTRAFKDEFGYSPSATTTGRTAGGLHMHAKP